MAGHERRLRWYGSTLKLFEQSVGSAGTGRSRQSGSQGSQGPGGKKSVVVIKQGSKGDHAWRRRVMAMMGRAGPAGRKAGSGFGGSQAVKKSVALHEGHALQLQRCATTSAKRPGCTEADPSNEMTAHLPAFLLRTLSYRHMLPSIDN